MLLSKIRVSNFDHLVWSFFLGKDIIPYTIGNIRLMSRLNAANSSSYSVTGKFLNLIELASYESEGRWFDDIDLL